MDYRTKAVAMVATALAALTPTAVMAQTAPSSATPPPAAKAGKGERKVTLDLHNMPLREALEKLFGQMRIDFSIDRSLQGTVTAKITDLPVESALKLLLRFASLPFTYVKEGDVYIVKRFYTEPIIIDDTPRIQPQTTQTKPTPPAPTAKADDKAPAPVEQTVSLDLRNTPIREALEKLFRQTKSDFSMDNAVQGYVTLKITDQPLETALRMLLRSAPMPLTYSKDAGVYIVKPRRIAQSAEASAPSLQGASRANSAGPSASALIADQDGNRLLAVTSGSYGGQQIETISLTYLDPADVADLLTITQVPSFTRQTGIGLTPKGTTIIASD